MIKTKRYVQCDSLEGVSCECDLTSNDYIFAEVEISLAFSGFSDLFNNDENICVYGRCF